MLFPDFLNNSTTFLTIELLQPLSKKQSPRFCKLSTSFKDLADDTDQTRGKMKLFIKIFPFSKSKKHLNLTRALSSLEGHLQIVLIFRLKLS